MYDKYEAAKGTTFYYLPDFSTGVLISPHRSERALAPVEDLVEFVETVYHGSEVPTAKEVEE